VCPSISKEKKKKRNINIDLAILPSHDKSIIMDRGAQFAARMMKKLYAILGINKKLLIA